MQRRRIFYLRGDQRDYPVYESLPPEQQTRHERITREFLYWVIAGLLLALIVSGVPVIERACAAIETPATAGLL